MELGSSDVCLAGARMGSFVKLPQVIGPSSTAMILHMSLILYSSQIKVMNLVSFHSFERNSRFRKSTIQIASKCACKRSFVRARRNDKTSPNQSVVPKRHEIEINKIVLKLINRQYPWRR